MSNKIAIDVFQLVFFIKITGFYNAFICSSQMSSEFSQFEIKLRAFRMQKKFSTLIFIKNNIKIQQWK